MKKVLGGLFLVLILISSCIFGPTSKRVMSFRYNHVYLSDRSFYNVGPLPETWKRMHVPAHSIAFYNSVLESTIATDAFCDSSFEDLPLKMMTLNLLGGVDKYTIEMEKEFALDERGALRTVASGSIDGVNMVYDIVVIKKNKCNIDFMSITPEKSYKDVTPDFESFYGGFHYE